MSERLAALAFDFEQVARAIILDGGNDADGSSFAVFGGQSDQVGVIIFALLERRQRGTVDFDQRAAQRLGGACGR